MLIAMLLLETAILHIIATNTYVVQLWSGDYYTLGTADVLKDPFPSLAVDMYICGKLLS